VKMEKIIFFAPHASIWVHAFPEALVADALASSGYSIMYVGCRGVLSQRCTTFDARGLQLDVEEELRSKVCRACIAAQNRLQRHFGYAKVDLEDHISTTEIKLIDAHIDGQDLSALLELSIEGIPVGRYASYETLLTFKKRDLLFNEEERRNYLAYLRGCIITLTAFKRVFASVPPGALITYNSLYATNRTVSSFAESLGAKAYTLHAGPNFSNRLQTLVIARRSTFSHLQRLLELWPIFRELPCPPEVARFVSNHLLEVLRGRSAFVYSAPTKGYISVRNRFQIGSDRKLLLATMSSYDERFAAEIIGVRPPLERVMFESQVDWIQWLVNYVGDRDDLFLVIRPHPRDFPNKRESRLSDHARLLQETLRFLPENVVVNWPADSIALYDFVAEVDVLLNGWSSSGKEFAMLGIPVVSYSASVLTYPADLVTIGETPTEYANAIEQALTEGWSLELVRKAYRWLALEHVYSVVDISDGFARSETSSRESILRRLSNRIRAKFQPGWREERECRARPKPVAQSALIIDVLRRRAKSVADVRQLPVVSEAAETDALINELQRLADVLLLNSRQLSPLARGILGLKKQATEP